MKYTFDSVVRYSETDENGRLSLGALINLFQDTSTMHSESVQAGVRALTPLGQTWILASWQIEMGEMPSLGDEIRCSTWGYRFKDFYGYRNFTLESGGKTAAWANSVWVLFDMNQQRPIRIPEDMVQRFGTEEPYPMEYGSRKMRPLKDGEGQEPFTVGVTHLDTNHHVNNGQYIQFAMNYLPEDFRIRTMRAEYKNQAKLGDEICPLVKQSPEGLFVSLNDQEGKPFALVSFEGAY